MILGFWEMLCTLGFLGAGLFFLSGVIVAVSLISIFTFGAPFGTPSRHLYITIYGNKCQELFQYFPVIFSNIFKNKSPGLLVEVGALLFARM